MARPRGGVTYAAARPATDDLDYWRIGHFLLPFYTYNAPGVLTRKFGVSAWVPLDDEHMMVWNISAPLTPEGQRTASINGLTNNTSLLPQRLTLPSGCGSAGHFS